MAIIVKFFLTQSNLLVSTRNRIIRSLFFRADCEPRLIPWIVNLFQSSSVLDLTSTPIQLSLMKRMKISYMERISSTNVFLGFNCFLLTTSFRVLTAETGTPILHQFVQVTSFCFCHVCAHKNNLLTFLQFNQKLWEETVVCKILIFHYLPV